jgi:hypothetical protein
MTDINISRYQTIDIIKFKAYTAADFDVSDPITMGIRGNAVLSTLFVTSIDAGTTLTLNYYQSTSSTVDDGERFDTVSHATVTDSTTLPYHEQVIATRIHNKPVLEVVITGGGSVTFGCYVTVNDELASDIDSALILDGDTFFPNTTKAIPIACYDEDEGKVFFFRCKGGALPTFPTEVGDAVHLEDNRSITPGSTQTTITDVVPAGKIRKINSVRVVCRAHGRYTIESDGSRIGSGRTGPANPTDVMTYDRRFPIAATKDITVKFTALSGAPSGNDVETYVIGSDEDI